jgi:hypothetical protein
MSAGESAGNAASENRGPRYRWGGIAAVSIALGYVAMIPLFAHVGPPPTGGEAFFKYLPGKTTIWWWIVGLSAFTDLLYIPLALALYMRLKPVNKYLMAMAVIFMGMFVVLDLAMTQGHYASILTLFHNYSQATDDAHRAAYLAAGEYAAAVLSTPMEIVYAIMIPSIGTLLAGIVMLKSEFGKVAAYLALITGVLGILALTGWFPIIMGNALFATGWFFVVGYKLIRFAPE